MSSFIPDTMLVGLGQGLSIVGLALCMPFCFAFRSYLRFLDHLQMFYAFAIVLSSQSTLFSNSLTNSWVGFDKNIFFFCTSGELVCTVGFPLSFGSCLLVFLLIMRLIVLIETCRKKQIRFEPVYTFFKGLTRWVYAPLSYWSIYFLIKSIKGQSNSLYSSIAIVAICVIFPLAQLVGYKLIQTDNDNIWRKWLEFANFYRLLFICGLMAIGSVLQTLIPFYIVYGVYAFYAILFTIKHPFHFRIVGRILFVLGEAMMVAVFSFFLFKQDFLTSYSLDFILVAALLLIDLVYHIAELIDYYRNGVNETESQRIAPEGSGERVSPKGKKGNSYEINLNDNDNQFDNSRENILDYEHSPGLKGNKSSMKSPPKRR